MRPTTALAATVAAVLVLAAPAMLVPLLVVLLGPAVALQAMAGHEQRRHRPERLP
jgi:hypothetical protein